MTKTNFEHYKELLIDKQYDHCEIYSYDEFMGMECHCRMGCTNQCFVKVIEWLNQPYQEPIKLTLFEKLILECAVNRGYEWIVKNEDCVLGLFKEKPAKDDGTEKCITLFLDCYPFIDPKERKVYSIKEILDNCEVLKDD